MSNKQQALWIGYFILAVSLMLVGPYFLPKISETLSYSQFKLLLKHGQLTEVVVQNKTISSAIKVEEIKEVFSPEKIKELGDARQWDDYLSPNSSAYTTGEHPGAISFSSAELACLAYGWIPVSRTRSVGAY